MRRFQERHTDFPSAGAFDILSKAVHSAKLDNAGLKLSLAGS